MISKALAFPVAFFFAFTAEARDLGLSSNNTVKVRIVSKSPDQKWVAAALEQAAILDLSRFDKVSVQQDQGALVAIELNGELEGNSLKYVVSDNTTDTQAASGTIRLKRGMSLISLKRELFRAIHPVVEPGGAIDRAIYARPFSYPSIRSDEASWYYWLLGALHVLLFLIPIVGFDYRFRIVNLRKKSQTVLSRSTGFRLVIGAAFVALFSLGIALNWIIAIPESPGLYALGGVLWGSLLFRWTRLAVPYLKGIEAVQHWNVLAILRAWSYVAVVRFIAVAAALYVLSAIGSFYFRGIGVPSDQILLLLTPVMLYFYWVLLQAVLEGWTRRLDDKLVAGLADDSNPWHYPVKKYVQGYIKRLGIQVDGHWMDQVLFLPGKTDEIHVYGSSYLRPRIVVSAWLLHFAMGKQDETARAIERSAELSTSMEGMILPRTRRKRATKLTVFQRIRNFLSSKFRAVFQRVRTKRTTRVRGGDLVGQNATLLGYVTPTPIDESVPLISDHRSDLEVVQGLLTYHYAQFQKIQTDEEYDDTDPTDLDFLFGALIRSIGVVERRENELNTIKIYADLKLEAARKRKKAAKWFFYISRVAENLRNLYRNGYSRYPEILADTYAVLHSARHHLLQFIWYRLTGRKGGLTVRASSSALYQTSRRLLESVEGVPIEHHDRYAFRATPRNRIVWLSYFFYKPITDFRKTVVRRIAYASFASCVLAVLSVTAHTTWKYSKVYQDRMTELKKQIEEKRNAEQ